MQNVHSWTLLCHLWADLCVCSRFGQKDSQTIRQTDSQTGKGRRWLCLFCLLPMPPAGRQQRQLSNKWGNGFIIKPNAELIKLLAQVLTPCLDDYRRTEAVEAETENPKKKNSCLTVRREMAENRERGQERPLPGRQQAVAGSRCCQCQFNVKRWRPPKTDRIRLYIFG